MNQTEWIIPCNPLIYNLQAAFTDGDEVYWRQNAKYEVGDIVYIYLSKGVGSIRYKAVVVGTDIKINSEDDPYWVDKTMQSQKLQKVLRQGRGAVLFWQKALGTIRLYPPQRDRSGALPLSAGQAGRHAQGLRSGGCLCNWARGAL